MAHSVILYLVAGRSYLCLVAMANTHTPVIIG